METAIVSKTVQVAEIWELRKRIEALWIRRDDIYAGRILSDLTSTQKDKEVTRIDAEIFKTERELRNLRYQKKEPKNGRRIV